MPAPRQAAKHDDSPPVRDAAPLAPPILVIDDDPDDILLIRRLLDQAEVDQPIVTFSDSADALTFLRTLVEAPDPARLTPCLMFLDIKMPTVHGFVLLKWVRRQPALDCMHVVMLSGSDEPEDRHRAEKLGADRYLVKFPSAKEMAAAVAEARAPAGK